ncbi:MAG TPA: hypothetical protein PKA76_18290, partial [Pirellulaceae bacterium]|nr:hypothetical protein [Pirellulaceae bacterium]
LALRKSNPPLDYRRYSKIAASLTNSTMHFIGRLHQNHADNRDVEPIRRPAGESTLAWGSRKTKENTFVNRH